MTAKKSKSVGRALKTGKESNSSRHAESNSVPDPWTSAEVLLSFRRNDIAKPRPDQRLSAEMLIRGTDCGFAEGPRLTSSWEDDGDRCWRTDKHEGKPDTFHLRDVPSAARSIVSAAQRSDPHWTLCISKTQGLRPTVRLMTKHINLTLV